MEPNSDNIKDRTNTEEMALMNDSISPVKKPTRFVRDVEVLFFYDTEKVPYH